MVKMFASVTSFLFGSNDGDNTDNVELMTSVLPHSDWELVDKVDTDFSTDCHGQEGEGKQMKMANGELCSNVALLPRTDETDTRHLRQRSPRGVKYLRQNATGSPSLMEDGWLLTPPPCFTASMTGCEDPVAVSPLENVLIEHPSMSVYHPRKTRSKMAVTAATKTPSSTSMKSEKRKSVKRNGQSRQDGASPRKPCAVAASRFVGLSADVKSLRTSERIAEALYSRGPLNKKQCERSNKLQLAAVKGGSQCKRNARPCGSICNRSS